MCVWFSFEGSSLTEANYDLLATSTTEPMAARTCIGAYGRAGYRAGSGDSHLEHKSRRVLCKVRVGPASNVFKRHAGFHVKEQNVFSKFASPDFLTVSTLDVICCRIKL